MTNNMENYGRDYEEEVMSFLYICGEKNAAFLSIPKNERKTEEYARLMYITKILGFDKVFLKLSKEAGNRLDKILAYMDTIKDNFNLINKWMLDFVKGIKDKKVQNLVADTWDKMVESVDKANFDVNKLC